MVIAQPATAFGTLREKAAVVNPYRCPVMLVNLNIMAAAKGATTFRFFQSLIVLKAHS
jgi:hypothetical protein